MVSRSILVFLGVALFVIATNAAPTFDESEEIDVDDFDLEVSERKLGNIIIQVGKTFGSKLGKEVIKEAGKEAAKQVLNQLNKKDKERQKQQG